MIRKQKKRIGPGSNNPFMWGHPMIWITFTMVPQTGHKPVNKHVSPWKIFEIQITMNTICKLEFWRASWYQKWSDRDPMFVPSTLHYLESSGCPVNGWRILYIGWLMGMSMEGCCKSLIQEDLLQVVQYHSLDRRSWTEWVEKFT